MKKSLRENSDILLAGMWFGLMSGLVEGLLLRVLQTKDLLQGPFSHLGLGPEIIWISPIINLMLFSLLGAAFWVLQAFLPKLPVRQIGLFLFVVLLILDWVGIVLIGRIRLYALFMLVLGLAIEPVRQIVKNPNRVNRLIRQSLPLLGVVVLLTLVLIEGGKWAREKRALATLPIAEPSSPNILVVIIDTLRADHLSSYGYGRNTSPTIDHLAEQGVLFENAISTSSWTKPAHASFLTGRYTYEHGADGTQRLDEQFPTIAEVLLQQGYRTGAFSANVGYFNRDQGFGRGFLHFEDSYWNPLDAVVSTFYGRFVEYYFLYKLDLIQYKLSRKRASKVNQEFIHWASKNQSIPFLAFINYFDVHAPYIPPQPYRGMYSDTLEPGGAISTDWGGDVYVAQTPEQVQGEVDAYDGAINYIDDHIAKILSSLEASRQLENTVVIITSDHGESFGEHGLFEHGNSLYLDVIQVPLIIWYPTHVAQNIHIAQPVSITSLPATLLDLAGIHNQETFPVTSLSAFWQGNADQMDWPDPLSEIAHLPWLPPQHLPSQGAMKSVITSQWHYIEHETLGAELYEWNTDPGELDNLIDQAELQSTVTTSHTILDQIQSSH